jgi:hypothetical protein
MWRINIGVILTLLVLTITADCHAKSWRGITPLKSTRADVERLFGKPNNLGRYEIENERAYVIYSDGPCIIGYQNLGKPKCECFVEKDTVLRIGVTLDSAVALPEFDKTKFSRASLRSNVSMFTYSDLADGVVYTVDESHGTLTAIDYWPSATDCTQLERAYAARTQTNSWRGIRPLHSTRGDVEKSLGGPQRQLLTQAYLYVRDEDKIEVLYSEGPCRDSDVGKWNVAASTVLRITIYPQRTLLLRDLNLDKSKYARGKDPHLPQTFFLVNRGEGVMIQTQERDGYECVLLIEYSRSNDDIGLLCKP